jgi:thioredoxin 2
MEHTMAANTHDPRGASAQVACPRCDGLVRVPADRLRDAPKCPRCHAALFEGHPVELHDGNFDRHVGQSSLPVVVDFWAPWCGPCRSMAPVFEQAAAAMEPAARFAKLNTDEAQQVAARYGIRSIPTLMVFRGGREVARQAGAMDPATLRRWLAQALA